MKRRAFLALPAVAAAGALRPSPVGFMYGVSIRPSAEGTYSNLLSAPMPLTRENVDAAIERFRKVASGPIYLRRVS
jgi:hypothetical protein